MKEEKPNKPLYDTDKSVLAVPGPKKKNTEPDNESFGTH